MFKGNITGSDTSWTLLGRSKDEGNRRECPAFVWFFCGAQRETLVLATAGSGTRWNQKWSVPHPTFLDRNVPSKTFVISRKREGVRPGD